MLERELEKKFTTYCNQCGFLCYKFTSPNKKGVPDRLIVGEDNNVAFLELKRKGQKPTKLQIREIEKLQKRGILADWCDNLEDAKTFINQLKTAI